MTLRQSNKQWSGGIQTHPAPKIPSAKILWKSTRLDFLGSGRHPPHCYLPQGQTTTPEYYSSLLVQLKDILKEKRRGKVTKGILFLHDKVPAHLALATQKKLAYLGFQCLDHHPILRIWPRRTTTCSLDLKKIKSLHFSSDAEIIAAAETCLDGQPSEFFLSGLQKLEQGDKKFIELRWEYVE